MSDVSYRGMVRRGAFVVRTVAPLVAMLASGGPSTAAQDLPLLETHADPVRLAAFVTAVRERLPYVPGELLIEFRDGTPTARQLASLASLPWNAGGPRGRRLGRAFVLTGLDAPDIEATAAAMRADRDVAAVQPNYLLTATAVPNDPQFARQWNLNDINMPAAWDVARTAGAGVIVAVLDSGLTAFQGTYAFRVPTTAGGPPYELRTIPFARAPDFDYARVLPGAEFTHTGPWTAGGQPVLFDAEGHGTHVAGTIAQQTNNGTGFAGTASGVTLLPVKVCSGSIDVMLAWGYDQALPNAPVGCTIEDLIAGIYFAVDQGAKVINLSLGGELPQPAVRAALSYATSQGVFVAISAGNGALDGNPLEFPAFYADTLPGVVAVGATTPSRTRAAYSTTGTYVELAAPGGAGGLGGCGGDADRVWQKAPDKPSLFDFLRFDVYTDVGMCGTSMATPHVSGAAALLYSQGIRNPAAIEAALKRTAVDLGATGRDNEFGSGLIDVRAALIGRGLGR